MELLHGAAQQRQRAIERFCRYFDTYEEAAEALGITRQWLYICRCRGELPLEQAVRVQEISKGHIKASSLSPAAKKLGL